MGEQDTEQIGRVAPCAVCLDSVAVDGKTADVFDGRVLCQDCIGEPVCFITECLDCGWSYGHGGRESGRRDTKVRVQQEANNHETEMEMVEDESHETVWREVRDVRTQGENEPVDDEETPEEQIRRWVKYYGF